MLAISVRYNHRLLVFQTTQQQSNFEWCIANVIAIGFLLLKALNFGLDVSFNLTF